MRKHKLLRVAGTVLLTGGTALAAFSGAAAASAAASQAFSYQFTATDSTTAYSPGLISDTPFTSNAEASQSLGANGVTLTITPQATPAKGCCDSGVLVKLGDLNSLFDSSGNLKPILIAGSGTIYANWIFDSNGNSKPLNYSAAGVLTDAGGDNYAYSDSSLDLTSAGTPGAKVADVADFLTVLPQGNSYAPGVTTMEKVHAAFLNGTVTGAANADPTVWLNVLVYGQKNTSATITSVNGQDLVSSATPTPTPTPSTSTPAPSPNTGSIGDAVNRFGNGLDVFRQHYAAGAIIAGWPATQPDPATHFMLNAGTHSGAVQFEAVNGSGALTGLCVSDPGGGWSSDPLRDGLILAPCNSGPWQQFIAQGNGTLTNVATGLIISPDGTGAQLRGTTAPTGWGGSVYSWKLVTQLPA